MSEECQPQRLSTDELFRRHAAFVARLLYRFGVAAHQIDDVLQEVFVVVHRSGGYAPGPATPKSYLAAIAIRAASSARRQEKSRRGRAASTGPDDLPSSSHDPVALLEVNQQVRQLHAVLAKLDPESRALLVLVELEGESCAAIAASQSTPVGTIYSRLHRAKERFRSLVLGHEYDGSVVRTAGRCIP